jgi:Glyoxalase-like domain
MMMIIDHLVYAAPDLAAAVDDLEGRLGVRAKAGGKHLDIGTHNALLALGPRIYLELIGPDPDQPQPANPRPFGIDELAAPRLVGWALGCDDIDAAVATARQRGYDPGDPIDMQRAASSGEVLRWRLTLNALGGGPLPFLIAGATPRIRRCQHHTAWYSSHSTSSTPNPARSQALWWRSALTSP